MCKGPEVGMSVVCSRLRKVTHAAGVWYARGTEAGQEGERSLVKQDKGSGIQTVYKISHKPSRAWIFLRSNSGHISWCLHPHTLEPTCDFLFLFSQISTLGLSPIESKPEAGQGRSHQLREILLDADVRKACPGRVLIPGMKRGKPKTRATPVSRWSKVPSWELHGKKWQLVL